MKAVVTGCSGYIGSILTDHLLQGGHTVVGIDKQSAMTVHANFSFVQLDLGMGVNDTAIKAATGADIVFHLAAETMEFQSGVHPDIFYHANVVGGFTLLQLMRLAGITRIVNSSSAAVYGGSRGPISEIATPRPSTTYGETKRVFEEMLKRYGAVYNMQHCSLRYFNVAGSRNGILFQIFDAVLRNKPFVLHGTEYATTDGAAMRDHIHVLDVVSANLKIAEAMLSHRFGWGDEVYNVGSGRGKTDFALLRLAEEVIGQKIPVLVADPWPGDSAGLIADTGRLIETRWSPSFNFEETIESAWGYRKTGTFAIPG